MKNRFGRIGILAAIAYEKRKNAAQQWQRTPKKHPSPGPSQLHKAEPRAFSNRFARI
jgi:hypothetical protein